MNPVTPQIEFWQSNFGKEYTDRNTFEDFQSWNQSYFQRYGISRLAMFSDFVDHLDRNAKILEVGCNTAMQLRGLQQMGFKHLYGIELQPYAVEKAKQVTNNINLIQGSAFDIPFKDEYFDLVMTNGVLIHIAPADVPIAMKEIERCSKKYIMGFEYYAESPKAINYRGNSGFLWKDNFSQTYQQLFPKLKLEKEQLFPYSISSEVGNTDAMFLLCK